MTPVASRSNTKSGTRDGRRAAGLEIYTQLKDDISGLRFMPGERLVELELCERYGISRTPVREALRRLEDDGLVVTREKGGRFVRGLDVNEYDEVYATRCTLEMSLVRDLAETVDTLDVAALRDDWRHGYDAARTPLDGSYIAADEKFHLGLAQATGNGFLAEMIERVNDRLRAIRVVDFTERDRLTASEEQHLAIIDAIAAADGDGAAKLVKAHIEQSKEEIGNILLRMLSRGRAAVG